MRLEKIKLSGFKSFVDPTTVVLRSNLVSIVGPNGCGKSNIIDAVRWVMGESSAKHLRGESMSDVIFNGSSARKPVGMASIELVFDNSDGRLQGEYASYTTLSVKRQVTREGQSTYFLNGVRCRRRDITGIFLGTGLGPRSYAIIEQGTVSRLVEAKPDELRVYIEEVAGISKYKERRRETENRMRCTQENLERLGDVRNELEKQLKRLDAQAKAAEKYRQLKAEETRYESELCALRWASYDAVVSAKATAINQLQVDLAEQQANYQSGEADVLRLRDERSARSDALEAQQAQFYQAGSGVATLEQSIEHQKAQQQQWRDDLARMQGQHTESVEQLASDKRLIAELKEEFEHLEPQLAAAKTALTQSEQERDKADEAMTRWRQAWEALQREQADARQQAEVTQTTIRHLDEGLSAANERETKLRETLQRHDTQSLEQQVQQLQATVEKAQTAVDDSDAEYAACQQRLSHERQAMNEVSDELDTLKAELQVLQGREASLKALQQAALTDHGQQVQAWLAKHGWMEHPRLAEGVKAESGWERAVEVVLSQRLDAVCVDDLDAVVAHLDELDAGAMTFYETTTAHTPRASTEAGLLRDKVSVRWSLSSVLAGIQRVDSVTAALAQRRQLAAHESLITPEGVWIGPDWLMVVRGDTATTGVLQREQELVTLSEEIKALKQRLDTQKDALDAVEARCADLEVEREQVQEKRAAARAQVADQLSQKKTAQAKCEHLQQRRVDIEAELAESHSKREQDTTDIAEKRRVLQVALDRMADIETRYGAQEAEKVDCQQARDGARAEALAAKEAHHALHVQHNVVSARLQSISVERLSEQVSTLAQRIAEKQQKLADTEAPLADSQAQLQCRLEERATLEQAVHDARDALTGIEQQVATLEKAREAIDKQVQDLRTALETHKLAWQEARTRCQGLQETADEAGFDLPALLKSMDAEAEETAWEQQLESIRQRIARLGAINLAAIEEFKAQSERKTYLDQQNDDLLEALETLDRAMAKIDQETRSRFKLTLDEVNTHLHDLFPRMFGGGEAKLELTSDDLLSAGVVLVARPPGKRNTTIHLLSGGEKALTAVSLVFALFQLNPAPFCLLDEVDAPLDDANVGRFCKLVKEMSHAVQFIFITHNKVTMESANQLMGVTMSEPGCSRLVAVDVDEAAAMVDS